MRIDKAVLGTKSCGQEIQGFDISAGDIRARVMTLGAVVMGIDVPDRNGSKKDIILGYDSVEEYLDDRFYLGALVGRYANRIEKGTFVLDGKEYTLTCNNGENHLHGGTRGFSTKVWKGQPFSTGKEAGVKLSCFSRDGEEGYPGNVACEVTYSVSSDNVFRIQYTAESTRPTPVNLASHTYFNLTGTTQHDIKGHELQLFAEEYVPVDDNGIPSGLTAPVKDTAFDFTRPRLLGQAMDQVKPGFDHTYVLWKHHKRETCAAVLYCQETGIGMKVRTTKPGVHLYTGNFLEASVAGKSGAPLHPHSGLCLEDQYFPNSPNICEFPDSILRPGDVFAHETAYQFFAE